LIREEEMRKIAWLFVPVLALAFTSCSITSAGESIETYPQTSLTINSKIVGQRLNVLECIARKTDTGILQGQVTVQNTTRKDYQFEYRFQWLDKDGIQIESGLSIWKPISISSKEKGMLKGTAPNKKAEDFIMIVRFNRTSDRWN